MSQLNEAAIRNVVSEVLAQMQSNGGLSMPTIQNRPGKHGVFDDADQAVAAARSGFEQLQKKGWTARKQIVDLVKKMCVANAERWGQIEFNETKIGRLSHKPAKLQGVQNVLGPEYLMPQGMSGDFGITMDEAAPWGVIVGVTPLTHSVPTIAGNIVNMVAAGNSIVFNPHPGGAAVAALAIDEFNEAIKAETGISNLLCTIEKPSIESFNALCSHDGVNLLCITGGPGVVNAAMKTGKRAVCAGPGNPPVLVDDCDALDFDRVARDIIAGGGFDNNLLCIGEKQIIAVADSYQKTLAAMQRQGAVLLNAQQLEAIKNEVFDYKNGVGCGSPVLNRKWVGANPDALAKIAGLDLDSKVEMLIAETDINDPFVQEEQMMPLLPIVRANDFAQGLSMAKQSEHGDKHSAMIHTMNVARMTEMGQAMDTTIFVKNGPCLAGLGLGGEGFISYSIATTTGEGITTPRTFTRYRRCTLVNNLNIVS
ncbi:MULTISPECIES: aldehyde dehydrogenase [unclassified Lentimonas]|uniref:aldehyde dehydrogenase n=1 Tax=unclassified Lentimonas TaxID=2630993 RepID=UPI00132072DD|nr:MULTISPECIES: aldehyde dehydrogenase [unclassified Lentimonas]CAA6679144.1 Acetaldehyde dehydrogenase, ethanolamine utilization cluster (EC [Lentimonas sp. CC4]CAA6684112.1 Acetaldehyde dehydrogenase, ethanolamine utilization cluster (EC [Lentimonas sp. CC6]CAA6694430.1 Acetaldehyde dehydrogenase, ethanolamine utilization cluster (EC [Lentimonas sp. CC19]CAA6697076.1 Acetaldehyde dehydrogenase, ethanolamine utilization cluster (EC [Lentimonas sp. CC10]CAA7069526.1 Acetaldehyde dehydrogenase